MRRKRSASLAVGMMVVVRFILQDEMRAQNDKQTNYFAGTTKQGKTDFFFKYEKSHNQQNSSTHE